jgi:tetratricopeptide (TPR) repeat protein
MPLYVLALAYKETRNYSKALATIDLLQKEIDKGDKSFLENDYSVYPQILRGGIYLDLGEQQKAVIEGKLALKILNSKGANRNDVRFIDTCELLGVSMALTGDTKGARKAIRLLESMSESTYYAWKYESLSRIYMSRKEYSQVLAAIRNPDAKVDWLISILFNTTFVEIPKMFILAKSLYETGSVKEAREAYDQLLRHPQIEQIGGIYWLVLFDRSKIALAEGQNKTAEDMLKKAIDVIEKGRSSINTEAGRIGFVDTAYYQRSRDGLLLIYQFTLQTDPSL